MIRRPPRSTLDRSSAASDVYKRQISGYPNITVPMGYVHGLPVGISFFGKAWSEPTLPVSYTHLRAHETVLDIVCRLLLENKKQHMSQPTIPVIEHNK